MSEQLYSVEDVADRLGLHVKTVRNYVREGRLKAVRIGKQYRISGEDLATLTGRPAASFVSQPVRRDRHIEVSSIVEIDAVSPDTAYRLATPLSAVGSGMRAEAIYDAQRAHMKIVLVGSMDQNTTCFRMINAILDSEK